MLTVFDFIRDVEEEIQAFKPTFDLAKATNLIYANPDNGETLGFVDVVIEGGGVKGVAALGALYALEECGLRFRKIAGTSAGAFNAAFLACVGRSAAEHRTRLLLDTLANINFLRFADGGDDAQAVVKLLTLPDSESALETFLNRAKTTVAILRNLNEVILRLGLNPGGRLKAFLCQELEKLRGEPFTVGALKQKWRRDALLINGEYLEQDFQVVASDISRRRKAIFPMDLDKYVRDPNAVLIGDLVRASASIPVFFSPFRLGDFSTPRDNLKAPRWISFVDGVIVSNFPLSIFDVSDFARPPACPTFGLTVDDFSAEEQESGVIDNLIKLGLAIFQTASQHGDKTYMDANPHNASRLIHISNRIERESGEHFVSPIDFSLSDSDKIQLFHNGVRAALDKLRVWNFHEYIRRYRG
jgi:NTE family protein